MRLMVAWLRPIALAIPRVLQCVAPRGVLSSVRTTTCSISSSVILRGAPGRGSSHRPGGRSRTNRVRHLPTVAGVARSRWATPLLSRPSHASTMRARRASAGTERDRWARDSNSRRSSLFKISGALGRPVRMLPPYRARRIGLAICFSYFCYRTLGPHEIEVTHHRHVFMLDVMAVEHIVTNVIFGPGRSGPRIRLRYKFEHDSHCVDTTKVNGFLQALLLRTRRLPISIQDFEHVSMDVDGVDPAARTIGQGPNLYRIQPWPRFPVLPITGNDMGLEEFSINGPFSMTPLELKFSRRHRLLRRKDFLNVPCRVIPQQHHGASVIGCDGRISFGSFRSDMKSQERRACLRREIVRTSPFGLL